jgi:hypothetical protein
MWARSSARTSDTSRSAPAARTPGSGSICAGDSGVRAGENGLLAKPRDLAPKDRLAGFDVIVRIRHGRDPAVE